MAAPLMCNREIELIHILSKHNGEIAFDADICEALGIGMGTLKVYTSHARSTLETFGITPSIIRQRNVGYRISEHAIAGLRYRSQADIS